MYDVLSCCSEGVGIAYWYTRYVRDWSYTRGSAKTKHIAQSDRIG
jgi:hypothetical protein